MTLLLFCIFALLFYGLFRPNKAVIDKALPIQHGIVVANKKHNAFTDMVYWKGSFFLVHLHSPWHLGSKKSKLLIHRSSDANHWEPIATLQLSNEEIRDPKFCVIRNHLFLYALKNRGLEAEPYTTVWSKSGDGYTWSNFKPVTPEGWLFWRPKTCDQQTWYVAAYWHQHGKSILLKSKDGQHWEKVSHIYTGDRNDETDIEFLSDGRILAVARLEVSASWFGHRNAGTLIAQAAPPYTSWTYKKIT